MIVTFLPLSLFMRLAITIIIIIVVDAGDVHIQTV